MRKRKKSGTGERIAALRKEKNLTLQGLADELGVTQTTLVRWEMGDTTNMGSKYLLGMAKLFDVSIDWILGLSDMRMRGR